MLSFLASTCAKLHFCNPAEVISRSRRNLEGRLELPVGPNRVDLGGRWNQYVIKLKPRKPFELFAPSRPEFVSALHGENQRQNAENSYRMKQNAKNSYRIKSPRSFNDERRAWKSVEND